jgi:hypothetical protein
MLHTNILDQNIIIAPGNLLAIFTHMIKRSILLGRSGTIKSSVLVLVLGVGVEVGVLIQDIRS